MMKLNVQRRKEMKVDTNKQANRQRLGEREKIKDKREKGIKKEKETGRCR